MQINTSYQLLSILESFIKEENYDPDPTIQLHDLMDLASCHGLSPVLYYILNRHHDIFQENASDIFSQLKTQYIRSSYCSFVQSDGMWEVIHAFHKHGIELTLFKGFVLKDLYPLPELRTMGDVDCLIHEKDRSASHQLLQELGFECTLSTGDVWVYKRALLSIEVHTNIARNGFAGNTDFSSYFMDAMAHTVEQGEYRVFLPEYHMLFLLYHISKHLSSTGAGVRMIMDLAVFALHQDESFDWDWLFSELERLNLTASASAVFTLANRWFHLDLPVQKKISETALTYLEKYILSGGVFGFDGHSTADVYLRRGFAGNKKSRSGVWYRIRLMWIYFFPSAEAMNLKNRPWLLPAAWVHRWYCGLFKRREHSLKVLHDLRSKESDTAKEEHEMLKELGL